MDEDKVCPECKHTGGPLLNSEERNPSLSGCPACGWCY